MLVKFEKAADVAREYKISQRKVSLIVKKVEANEGFIEELLSVRERKE